MGTSVGGRSLAAVDDGREATLLAASAWSKAGRVDEAEKLLRARTKEDDVEARIALARMIGSAEGAREVIETSLRHVVGAGEKARLHEVLAEVEERAGNTNRAEAERRAAAMLRR